MFNIKGDKSSDGPEVAGLERIESEVMLERKSLDALNQPVAEKETFCIGIGQQMVLTPCLMDVESCLVEHTPSYLLEMGTTRRTVVNVDGERFVGAANDNAAARLCHTFLLQ